MRITKIVPNLPVANASAAARWYAQVFGIDVLHDMGWVAFAGPENKVRPELQLLETDAQADVDPVVSIGVDDVDAAYRAVVEVGAPIVYELSDEEWGVRRFFFRNPDNNVINVVNHRTD
jgi:predicted enzyme related to lactoylglutathione lyase